MRQPEAIDRRWRLMIVTLLFGMIAALAPTASAGAGTSGTIRGTVTAPGAAPVADVLVGAFGDFEFVSGITHGADKYTITGVTPGTYFLSFIPPDDSGLAPFDRPGPVVVTARGTQTVNVELALAGGCPGPSPALAACCSPASTSDSSRTMRSSATGTDVNGDYEVTGMAPGTYTMSVLPPSSYGLVPTFVSPVVGSSAEPSSTSTSPWSAGGTVAGVVMRPGGEPIPGVQVEAIGEIVDDFAITNLYGEYSFTGLPAGDYQVMFTPPEGSNLAPFIADPVTVASGVMTRSTWSWCPGAASPARSTSRSVPTPPTSRSWRSERKASR